MHAIVARFSSWSSTHDRRILGNCEEGRMLLRLLTILGAALLSVGCKGDDAPPMQWGLGTPPKDNQFQCPVDMAVVVEPWGGIGEDGWERFCAIGGIRQGPFRVYTHGRKQIDGQFRAGKKEGTWLYYGRDGRIDRSVRFREGTELERIDGPPPPVWSADAGS
jgi:hypothetical protein